jgi:tetratricopeptide (TPR) repeat protein
VRDGLAVLAREDVPAWRATLLELLAPHAGEPAVMAALRSGLTAADPLERAAAVRGLTPVAEARPWLRPLLADPVRLVRLDAARALRDELPPAASSSVRRELDAYHALGMDQPAGQARLGMELANQGRFDEALPRLERAAAWDSADGEIHYMVAQVLVAQGKLVEAGTRYLRIAEARPDDAQAPYRAGLAFAEAGRAADAEKALRLSLRRDPERPRVWYNLGLLLAGQERLADALVALAEAEKRAPTVADYPFAAATVHLRLGDAASARAAAARTLKIDPSHPGARRLLGMP